MLRDTLIQHGAVLAPDGIPLHFGDQAAEYEAALSSAVLLNRSHEGRLELRGRDRLALPHRMSTNALEGLKPGTGSASIFTNPNARILDRAVFFQAEDRARVITEPGRGPALLTYLQRNIFFNDEVEVSDQTAATAQFALHGPKAEALVERLAPGAANWPVFGHGEVTLDGISFWLARSKPLSGSHWTLVCAADDAGPLWNALITQGAPEGLRPAGSLLYNILRVRAGRPGVGRELSETYIPLEVGLWDEVSFQKGCYTGQEIIARMESRGKLARLLVQVQLEKPLDAPADIFLDGHSIGTLTSSAVTPNGEPFGLAVLKTSAFGNDPAGLNVHIGNEAIAAQVMGPAGSPPPLLRQDIEK